MNGLVVAREKPAYWQAEADFIEAAARWWWHVFDTSRIPGEGFGAAARIELRLWGLPRAAVKTGLETLRQLLAGCGGDFGLEDADTIRWRSPWGGDKESWHRLAGQLLDALLKEPQFENLYLMMRLELVECYSQAVDHTPIKPRRQNALVLWGQIQPSRYIIRAVWPARNHAPQETVFHHSPWPVEGDVLKAIEVLRFGQEPEIPALAPLFPTDSESKAPMALTNLVAMPKVSLGGLAWRVGLFSLILGGGIYLIVQAPLRNWWALLPAFGALMALQFLLNLHVGMVKGVYANFMTANQNSYTQALRIIPKELGTERQPSLTKYSADLEAAGARHIADIRIDPAAPGDYAFRLYLMPDEATVFALNLASVSATFTQLPAQAVFLVWTYFEDDCRVVGGTHRFGYSKPVPIKVESRRWMECPGVPEMLAFQQKLIEWQLAEGKRLGKVAPEEIIPLMIEEHEQLRPYVVERGFYSWEEAIRFTYDIPRSKYKRPKIDFEALKQAA